VVFADGVEGEVVGSASVVRLVQSAPAAPFGSVCEENPLHLHPDWDLGEIVRKMSDFNLIVAPVLDPEHRTVLGVVTVDDVLDHLLPDGWRDADPAEAADGVNGGNGASHEDLNGGAADGTP